MPEKVRTANERLRSRPWREGFLAAFASINLCGTFLTPAHAGVGLHISFRAKDRAQVHAFYDTALAQGGRDAGAPGPRPQYTAGFYGAFVFDPDGYKIEAVVREAL